MAVYTNDLRLKEIATGDESGTWGTSTNTNLSLVAEAFSFGTEAITTNADTHTTTIADGATDPGRSIFLKYTGTLDSVCTITIGPNTVSKLWLIENATSGGFSIIIKQGSGATITVPNGQTKAIYSDGAGSGGAMVDAFQDLSIPDLFIDDDLTFTSDSAVITFGADGDTTLTHTDGSGLTLNSTNKLMFNDASQFIQGSSATVLSLGATDEIDLTATAIDVNGTIDVSGNATLGGTLGVTGAVTANAGVSIDNITIDGTEIDLSSGSLTLDVAGGITFDADDGQIDFKDGGTVKALIDFTTDNVEIQARATDGDLIFRGQDGSSFITALTLDMSEAGAATFNAGATFGGAVTITETGSGSASGPFLNLFRDSSSPADDDDIGIIQFQGDNDAGSAQTYARIGTTIQDASDGTEDGTLFINTITAGANRSRMIINGTETVFNEASADLNFRVESDGNTHMLFVDAGNDTVVIGSGSITAPSTVDFLSYASSAAGRSAFVHGSGDGGVVVSGTGSGSAASLIFGNDWGSNGSGFTEEYRLIMDGSDDSLKFKYNANASTALTLSSAGAATFGGALSGTTASFATSSTSDSVFTLTDTGVAAYEVIFPDTGTYQLQTNTSSNKTFKLFNQGTGTFLLDVEGAATFGGDVTVNSETLKISGNFPQLFFEDTAGSDVDAYIVNNANGFFIGKTNSPSSSNDIVSIDLSTGGVVFNDASNDADFRVESDGNTHALFVDAGNNRVQFGKSSGGNTNTAGVEIQASGFVGICGDDFRPVQINRQTSDGDIIEFRKDGTNAGSIGAYSGDITIGTGDTGLTFEDAANVIHSVNSSSGAARDAAIDLGKSASRFKDLYISGGINNGTNAIAFSGGAFAGDGSGNDANIDLGRTNRRFQNLYLSGGIPGTASGELVINENSADSDFRVESDGDTHCLFVDSSDNVVLFGKSTGSLTTTGAAISAVGTATFAFDLTSENESFILNNNNSTGTTYKMDFRQNNSTKGQIVVGSSSTAYNTSSDYRLKENVETLKDGLSRLAQLKPVQFTWTTDGALSEGFIAHEVDEVFPDAVTGEKDAIDEEGNIDAQQLDYGRITPLLVKAIQEQQEQIEELKAEIAILKGG